MQMDKKISKAAGIGAIAGYLTLFGQVDNVICYLVIIATIYTLNYTAVKMNTNKKTAYNENVLCWNLIAESPKKWGCPRDR